MSPPVRTEARDITSFPFLRPSRPSSLHAPSSLGSRLSSRHVSPIRPSSRRHTIVLLLLLILELRPTRCAAGVATIGHNRGTSESPTGQSRIPQEPNVPASGRSDSSKRQLEPAVDSSTPPARPHRRNADTRTIEREPPETFAEVEKKRMRHEEIIHEDGSRAIPTRGKTSLGDAIFPAQRARRREIAENYATTDETSVVVSTLADRGRLTSESVGGFAASAVESRVENGSLDSEDNWYGSSGGSQDSVNEALESSPRFATTYDPPASPLAAPVGLVELEKKIPRDDSSRAKTSLYDDEIFTARRAGIAAYYIADTSSLVVRRRSSRDGNSSLDIEDNWNGSSGGSKDTVNEGLEGSAKFTTTYNPPASPLAAAPTSLETQRKITHEAGDENISPFPGQRARRAETAGASGVAVPAIADRWRLTRGKRIGGFVAPVLTSRGDNSSFLDVEDNWNGSSSGSKDTVNEGLEGSPKFTTTYNPPASPLAAAPTSLEAQRKITHEAGDENISPFPGQRARRAETAGASSVAVSAIADRWRLTRGKRIGGFVAPVLTSRGDNSSSLDIEDKWNGSSVVSQDGVNDGVEGSPKFPEKQQQAAAATHKPPGAPGTPVEKYDRRHFGPPRLENPEEVSKETSEATGSSSAYARPSFAHFTAPSSTPMSSSSSPILPNLASDSVPPPLDLNDTRGSVAAAAAAGGGGSGSRVQATRGEEFYRDNKSNGNEAHVSAIDRLDDRVDSTAGAPPPALTADGAELPPQSSTAISKLSGPERRKLVTMRPRVNTGARGATEGTSGPRHGLVDKLELTILGLFELTQGSEARPEGPSELQAARLAVDRINDIGALPNIHLRLIHNDTRCDPGVAVDRFFHALYTSKNTSIMPLLLGTACSEVTETLAKIVPYWNIVQVSFGSTAPALSDPTEFPLFVRTVAPDSSHNPARISLIKHFGWDTVTALSQNGDMYSLAVNDLVTELEQANITCTATITFGENDYKEQLRTLKELDTRIIIGSFAPDLAPRLFCEAWKLGMHGGDYAWILPGETIDLSGMTGDWWHSGAEDCTPSQLSQTLDGLIIVKSYGTGLAEQPSFSGLTTSEFTSELAKRGVTLSRFAGQTYDAVWSMALALGKLETYLIQRNSSIAQYSHSRKDMAYRLLGELKGLNFLGVSGPVSFDGADRVGITAFYQMHGHVVRRVALYTPEDGQLTMNCAGCARTRWPGEHPPVARRVFRFRMVTIDYAAFLAVTCLASVGVTLALSFLAFNLHFRKHKSIKLSSPRLNNMAAVGCALVYGAVILLGLDHATLSDSNGYFPTICTARAYLLSAGFSLAFGSMFTKTYRVHRIFTRSRSGVVKNKLLQDTQLISLICVLLLIDGLVVTLWVTLDPMQRDLRNLTLEISSQNRAVIFQPQVEVCRSQHTNGWLAALYAYKGLLLIVGVYMAWETRHVKIPALNDSQYIGMSVYSVVITSGIVVVLANLMSDRATLAFVTITTLILASTTATLALLFLPQLANILAGERADPVVQSLGLKIECNTRRFVTDDSRELQYRVEVQNRVYRREMAQLELELARLEKQLGQEPVEPSHASSSASIPQRNPSIGGGLPLLLLSVLPPVIPRASWPSADPSGMRRGTVAFSSQPDLEPDEPRRSLADIYKLQWRRDTEGPSRLGVFQRLFSLFGSRPSSRKTSTASFTGVASALRVHMGYIAGLVPGTKASSSCQVNVQGIRTSHPRCGSGPIISITSEEDRRLSLGLRRKESSEPRVNFSLPSKSTASQSSSRERIRGSPRFPHRIVPANSLSAIAPGSMTTAHQRWHSMEDASRQRIVSCTPRGSTYGPSFDVWAFREKAIPLSEFDDRTGGRKVPDSLALTVPADSNVSPDDGLLGSDLRKLFRENTTSFGGSEDVATPLDGNAKLSKLLPSPRNSPTKIITLIASSQADPRATRTSAIDSVQDTQVSVGNESKHSQLSLSKSKVVVIRENNGHCVEPEFLLKATSSEVTTTEAKTIDEESSGPCDD